MAAVDELDAFIDKYDPPTAALTRAVLAKLRKRLPGAFEIVYNYNHALVIAFGASDKGYEAVFSIAVSSQLLTFCFGQGATLPDPARILKGSGKQVRGVRIEDAKDLDAPAIKALMKEALAKQPVPKTTGGRVIVKAPRRGK